MKANEMKRNIAVTSWRGKRTPRLRDIVGQLDTGDYPTGQTPRRRTIDAFNRREYHLFPEWKATANRQIPGM